MAPHLGKREYENDTVVDLVSSDDESSRPHKYARHAHRAAQSTRNPGNTQHLSQPQRGHTATGDSSQRDNWQQPWSQYDDPDADVEITTSQDFDDNAYQSLMLYGHIQTKIVGLQYYRGHATMGECVVLRREPTNPYDSNAIRCDNVEGTQIGHIPRTTASKLAPFMDSRSLAVEGQLTGVKGPFDVPISLKLLGTSDRAEQTVLKQRMKDAKLPVAELIQAEKDQARREKELEKRRKQERKNALKAAANRAGAVRRGGDGVEIGEKSTDFANLTVPGDEPSEDSQPSMDDILEKATSFNPCELSEVVDKYGQTEQELSNLPMAEQPAAVATTLLPYQRQGLAWLLDRENPILPPKGSKDIIQLWQSTSSGYKNIATNYTMTEPKLTSGGLLADDMGLGKTLQIVSLIAADPKRRAGKPTLIVAPLSVMSNWSGQIKTHIKSDQSWNVLTYHGTNRNNQKPEDFAKFDVVITTYDTIALEYMPSGTNWNVHKPKPIPRAMGLFSIEWRRVVLDEGHACRNPSTKKAQAAYALLSRSRWVLTGTPIVNNLKDLYSLVRFIGLTGGLQQQDVFSSVLIRPLNQGNADAAILLKALMSTICLRRMKDMKFIDLGLPELTSHKYSIAFLPHEREKYEAFQQEAKGLLVQYQTRKDSNGQKAYSHLLEVLLRMRQTCNHWKLCGERVTDLMALLEQNKVVELNPENIKRLQDLLQLSIDSQEECPICLETLHDARITPCAHVFGCACIERVIETQHKCPMCRSALKEKTDLVAPRPEPSTDPNAALQDTLDINTTSSKIEALLDILKASRKKDPTTKTVVFSQWTSFLDVIQRQLSAPGNDIGFCRLDGSMSATRRDEAMARLATNSSCTVMLASLAVCSVGLNLVAANQVILADSWWAPAIEDQAVDRVHRLGQQRAVTVFRLVMEGSVEERVLGIQMEKRKLMEMAFGERGGAGKRGVEKVGRLADIKKLLG